MILSPFLLQWSVFAERFVSFLGDISLKSLLLIAAGAVIALMLRRASAAHRHLVWLLALAATLCLPLLSAVLPSHPVHPISHAVPVQAKPQPAPYRAAPGSFPAAPHTATVNGHPAPAAMVQDKNALMAQDAPTPVSTEMERAFYFSVIAVISLAVSAFWLLGTFVFLGRIGVALLRLSALRRTLSRPSSEPLAATIAQVVGITEIKHSVAFFQAGPASKITVPLTWGIWFPLVVLPFEAAEWPEERLRAALLHEIAHIKRGDWGAQMLGSLACALYWFNPCVWAAARRMQREGERAADDYALTHGLRASDYAAHLVEIARAVQDRRPPRQATAMVQQSKFEHRLQAILGRNSRQQVAGKRRVAATLAALCLLFTASAFRFSAQVGRTAPTTQLSTASPNAALADPVTHQATLPNGTVVRLAGIADTQSKNRSAWWTAKGAPVTERLPQNTLIYPTLPAGIQGRAFAVTTTYTVAAQPKSDWIAPPIFGGFYIRAGSAFSSYYAKPNFNCEFEPDAHLQGLDHFQEQETRQGAQITRLTVDVLSSWSSAKTVTLKYAVAAGPWTESVECQKTPGKTYINTPSGQVIFTLIPNPHHLPAAQAARANAQFMVSDHFRTPSPVATQYSDQAALRAGENYDRVVQGLDKAGRVVADVSGSIMTNPDGPIGDYQLIKTMQAASIPNSVLKRIASFRLLARPYQWAEFRDIPLKPQVSAAASPATHLRPQVPPGTSVAHKAHAPLLAQKDRRRDGIRALRRAVHLDPNNAEAQYQLAQALSVMDWKQVGNTVDTRGTTPAVLDEAIEHMGKAVSLRPNVADWQSTLGTYLENRGLYAQAVPFYRRALLLLPAVIPVNLDGVGPSTPGYQDARATFDDHWLLAEVLLKTNQYRESASHYERALQYRSKTDWLFLGYGDALHGDGRRAEAIAAWKKVIVLDGPKSGYGRQARERLAQFR